jgi:hypothetical protein
LQGFIDNRSIFRFGLILLRCEPRELFKNPAKIITAAEANKLRDFLVLVKAAFEHLFGLFHPDTVYVRNGGYPVELVEFLPEMRRAVPAVPG